MEEKVNNIDKILYNIQKNYYFDSWECQYANPIKTNCKGNLPHAISGETFKARPSVHAKYIFAGYTIINNIINPQPAKYLLLGKNNENPRMTSNTPLINTREVLNGKKGGIIRSYQPVWTKWSIPTYI